MEHKVIEMIDGQPTFLKPLQDILKECKKGGALKILDPLEYHTEQQRKWYKGICLKKCLSDWNGETVDEWDLRLKAECNGNELLKTQRIPIYSMLSGKKELLFVERLTIIGVCKRNLTQFIENILSKAITENWPVTPPDKELRK